MSETATKAPSNSFAKQAVPLLKEYVQKLNDLAERASGSEYDGPGTAASLKYARLMKLYQRLRPPAVQLIRRVSQMVEHGKLDDFARLELTLRLAEFEHALESAADVFGEGP